MILEKTVMLICLFAGFYWLRNRARSINLENQRGKSLFGVFVLLPALLIGEKYLFDKVHFGTYTDLLLKALAAVAIFPAIGYGFLKPEAEAAQAAESGAGEPPES